MFNATNVLQIRQLFEYSVDKHPNNIALVCDDCVFSYQELESRVNQLANYLIGQGINEQHCVGILLERSLYSYLSILAVLKTGAAYVPIETELPDARISYIFADMPFHSVITSISQFTRQATIKFPNAILIDGVKDDISKQPTDRPKLTPCVAEALCYVIYTSGSTGTPKGVEITHNNICHYVAVASKLYNMSSEDRIYQGFSLAFDASLEELWMAFANGAALVACTIKDMRSGIGLIDFLNHNNVTVFSTVPTLLATLNGTIPNLRLLILGGEACTANLIQRWSRAGLKIMNTYGPTEATVIATYSECYPDKPITIGKPLPGYDVFILDEKLQPLPNGQAGELCIAGLGLARGYVNRPDLTAIKFIKNPRDVKQRLYRTGDLATITSSGDIQFMGRIDEQVKLRGFRIELNEIETVIMAYAAINQAVVSLQELESPVLVAYLIVDKNSPFDLSQLKHALRQKLPHYMIPSHFELMELLPTLSSGKINRKALPKPKKTLMQANYVPPQTNLEQTIAAVWEKDLHYHPISTEADFFYDLGGHSLTAAKVISNLRDLSGMEGISILDLYNNPTVKKLAGKIGSGHLNKQAETRPVIKNKTSIMRYFLCSVGQFFGCLLQFAVRAWQLLVVILCYNLFLQDAPFFSKESLLIYTALFLGMPIVSSVFVILAKWILLGRVKAGVYKVWGWFYFRWWLVDRLQNNVLFLGYFIGSPLIILYYRLLGANIGKNCYISSENIAVFDLLTIGDNSSVGYDACLLGYVVQDGWLKIGPITIGNNCFVGARSVIGLDTVLHDASKLGDMSMLPSHGCIPTNQYFSGSPACRVATPPDHISNQNKAFAEVKPITIFYYGILHYLCFIFNKMVYFICFFPALTLIVYFHKQTHSLFTVFIAAPTGAIAFLGLYYLAVAACKKLLMNRIKPGVYSIYSLYYLRQWLIVQLLDTEEVYVLADTLFFPCFLRLLGAKLGKRVEMGEAPHLIPDLITIHDEGFTASAAALAWPSVYQSKIKFASVQIGKRGFIGNGSLLPAGSQIGDGVLLGCMTMPPTNNRAADNQTTWLGSPAIFLPRREKIAGYSDSDQYTPSRKLFNRRILIEFIRIILPMTFVLMRLFNMLYLVMIVFSNDSLLMVFLLLPVAELLIVLGLVLAVVLLKWFILGRVKPATKSIWNVFIRKNDIIISLYAYFVNPYFTNLVLGTAFAPMLLRCLGSKIGKKVFINTSYFTEFDLTSIGNETCINFHAVIQTHLYEDRIYKMSTVNIDEGSNIGIAALVLYDAVMKKNSNLGDFSLLMKGERLAANTHWQGIPAQPISNGYVDTSANSLIIECHDAAYRQVSKHRKAIGVELSTDPLVQKS
ncbi:MAG: Pls/PosA family non-ribosomal peptide synthetase [Legionellales bacterium]